MLQKKNVMEVNFFQMIEHSAIFNKFSLLLSLLVIDCIILPWITNSSLLFRNCVIIQWL